MTFDNETWNDGYNIGLAEGDKAGTKRILDMLVRKGILHYSKPEKIYFKLDGEIITVVYAEPKTPENLVHTTENSV